MDKLISCLLVLCAACGDDGPSVTPDAMQGADAGADAVVTADCSGAAPVTVVGPAIDPEDAQLTTTVVAHDATGAMCSMKAGGSESEAHVTIDVPPGGMVTMVVDTMAKGDHGDDHGLFTWTEVQPGDELLFPVPQHGAPKLVDVEVTVPTLADVTTFEVYIQCEHGGGVSDPAPAGTFTGQVECSPDATSVAAMVAAQDGITKYAVSAVTPIAASGPTTLTVGTWMPAAEPTVTVHGAAGFDRAYAGYVPGATPDFHSVTMLDFAASVSDPMTIGPRSVPPTWSEYILVAIGNEDPAESLQMGVAQASPTSLDVTVATDFLPRVSGELVASLPRPSISWSMARTATADAVYINAGHWLIVTRPEPGTVRFPEVPASLLPTDPATVAAISLVDGGNVSGFDELRKDPALPYTDPRSSVSTLGDTLKGIVP